MSRRGVRHTTATLATARRLHAAGWTPHEIQKHLAQLGVPVAFATVKSWVDEEYRQRRNRVTAEDQRRWRDVAGEHVRRRMIELSDRGLSHAAISTVIGIYHGREISPSMVGIFLRTENRRQRAAA